MIYLKPIIQNMSILEKEAFRSYLISKNKRKSTKNTELLRLLSNSSIEESELNALLYHNKTKGAYHGLRKRFSESLIQFYLEYSEVMNKEDGDITSLVQAIRRVCVNGNFELAKLLMTKAESECENHRLFFRRQELIDIKLQFSQELKLSNVEDLFTEFKENQKLVLNEQRWNMAFAWINQVYNNMSFENQIINPESLIKEMFEKFDLGEVKFSSIKNLFQITTAFTQFARLNRDFYSIQKFVLKYYRHFELEQFKMAEDVYFYLELQYLMANIYFRNKNFTVSQDLLSKLNNDLRFYLQHKSKFEAKILCLRALNLHFSGQVLDAIELLVNKKNKSILDLDSQLTLVMFLFQNDELSRALQYFKLFKHTNGYYEKKAGKEWVIHKQFIAIILYMELGHIDKCYHEIKLFIKTHAVFLRETNQDRILVFIKLLEEINEDPNLINSTPFKEKVIDSIEYGTPEKEDVFMISGYAWLKSKLMKSNLYKTTLELIQSSSDEE